MISCRTSMIFKSNFKYEDDFIQWQENMDLLHQCLLQWANVDSIEPSVARNVALVLGCLAEKLAGRRSIDLFSEPVMEFLLQNLVRQVLLLPMKNIMINLQKNL